MVVGIPPFFSQNVNEMYHKIMHGSLRFPPFMSDATKSVICHLLNRTPSQRLGCRGEKGLKDLSTQEFFRSIDWDEVERGCMPVPPGPVSGLPELAEGMQHSDNDDNAQQISPADQEVFLGFEKIVGERVAAADFL